jgi:hypothetical protein
MKELHSDDRARILRFLSQVEPFAGCLSKPEFEVAASILPLWDAGPTLEIVHGEGSVTINGTPASSIERGASNFGIYRWSRDDRETIIKLVAWSPVAPLASVASEVVYLDRKRVHEVEDYDLEGMGVRQQVSSASRRLWGICQGALRGGPVPLGLGVCAANPSGRSRSYYLYVELECLDTDDADALTLKDLLHNVPVNDRKVWLDQHGLGPCVHAGQMFSRAVCDGIDPGDPDFMFLSSGTTRWIDTDSWRELDRGDVFTIDLILITSDLRKIDPRAGRAFLSGLFRGWITSSASLRNRVRAFTLLCTNLYFREFAQTVVKSLRG